MEMRNCAGIAIMHAEWKQAGMAGVLLSPLSHVEVRFGRPGSWQVLNRWTMSPNPRGLTPNNPVRAHQTITSPTPAPGDTPKLLSYYRHYAWTCNIAAQKSPTKKQRDELRKMVRVWREFAAQHEKMIRAGAGQIDARNRHIPDWI